MQQNALNTVKKGDAFEGFLRVKSSQQRTSSNGSKYLDMTLSDVSGEVNAKMWDGTVIPPEPGSVVKARGLMQDYNGRPQFRIDRLRAMTEKDDVDMSMLIPCAPNPAQDMFDELTNAALAMKNPSLRDVVLTRLTEVEPRLMYFPAAQRIHHAERAGLLHHTTSMLHCANALLPLYPFLDADLLRAGIILHDLSKVDELISDELGLVPGYTVEGQLIGHIVQGSIAVDRICRTLNTPDELRIMLEHMLLSHHELPDYGSPKPPMFAEAEMLSTIDRLDARMFEISHATTAATPGDFTEKIWSLDRKLYRRRETGERGTDEG